MALFKRFLREWGLTVLVLAVLLGAYLLLRTPAGPLRTMEELQGYLGAGRPVLVEVYSNT